MIPIKYTAAALGCLIWLAAAPVPMAAQEGCTMKCACVSSGCGCSTEGGNGAGCTASGYGCMVDRCEPIRPVGFAPDGSVLVADQPPTRVAGVAEPQKSTVLVDRGDWEAVSRGHAIARGCLGIVMAEWYAPDAAARLRAASRSLLL